jgi:ubiquinone/menaquinone biosynthesis C-methylase UbiE
MQPPQAFSEAFKNEDASSYDEVAANFDHFTRRLTTPLAKRMIALAELSSGARVLDVGTGTGVVAFLAANKMGLHGKVVGVDLSDGMLAAAEDRARRANLANRVEFRKMDAEALQFTEGMFDAALSLFALLHFPEPLAALQEMYRVLRPGGRLVFAVGSGPPWLSIKGLSHRVKRVPEWLLGLQGKRLFAPAFLNDLVEQFIPGNPAAEQTDLAREHHNRSGRLLALVRKAGFRNLRSCWEGAQAIVSTPEEFWDLQRTFSSIGRKRLSRATAEQRDRLRRAFFETCRDVQARGGRLVYPIGAFYVVAERP